MSLCQTYQRWAAVALVLAVVLVVMPAVMNAQTAPNAPSARSDDTIPKWDLFIGYQWLNPGGNAPDHNSPPNAVKLPSLPKGGGVSLDYNITKYLALEASYGADWGVNTSVNTLTAGPKLTYRGEGVDFFVHSLIGDERLAVSDFPRSEGFTAILGGGMDLKVWKHFSIRLFEADYQWSQQSFASVVPENNPTLQSPRYEGALLRTGVVFNLGGQAPLPVAAACSVQNPSVMVGEPVHVSVAGSNFNPKHALAYTWTSSGGTKIEGKDTSATIDTNGVAGGSYTVTATVTDPKEKKNNTASCSANFSVTEPPKNPPQISCSASPSMVQAGTSSMITCACTSPDNVPVTVGGWSSSGGSISGRGNTATLGTAGAPSGPITIHATCTDSRGLTASTSTSVTVENPPPPPPPQATKVNECEYPNVKKPWRVDNTCKAMLDDVAAKLQQDPDAKLIVVGNSGPKERRKNLAAERAVDVKYYLTEGEAKQHIDPSRIECRTATEGTMTTEQWIIPAGATFPEAGTTTPVDEKKVKAIPDHPKPAAKKAAKKAP